VKETVEATPDAGRAEPIEFWMISSFFGKYY